MRARGRGDGRVFKRKGSASWWIAYCFRGREFRESARSEKIEDANELLKKRLDEIGADRLGLKAFVGPVQDKLRVDDALDALETVFRLDGRITSAWTANLKAIRKAFGYWRAIDVTEEAIDRYIQLCLSEEKSAATINRRTQVLGQALRLAVQRKHLSAAPKIRRLPENNARQGFFEKAEFEKVRQSLPEYLKDLAAFCFLTGWRKKEAASLTAGDVDLDAGLVHLRAEDAKNRSGRKVALAGELLEIVQRRLASRQVKLRGGTTILTPLLFHKKGKPVGDFRKSWKAACKAAEVEGRLFHDLRRTSIRNMIRAGVPESVAMKISGHKTRAVFDRYNITDDKDLKDAMLRTQEYLGKAGEPKAVVPFNSRSKGRSK